MFDDQIRPIGKFYFYRPLGQAREGQGQIVGVLGEPGLGKSRLFYEFVGAYDYTPLRTHGCLVLEAFSVSHGKASPYLPLIELLKSYFQIEAQEDGRTRREKVTGRVLTLDRSLEETLPYFFELLGIEDASPALQQMDPQVRRQRTFEALKRVFLRESVNQPLIIIFEDLHWIDNETQGFLDVLSESVANAQILLLVNYRPEYRTEWGHKTYLTQLRLAALGKDEAEELLTFLLGNDAGMDALKRLILERTEGTPFFMEEVVQTLVEEGALSGEKGRYHLEHAPTELHISPTVQGVLAARIDRLEAAEKALLQQLAVIGREFPLGLVRTVVAKSEDELYRLLAALQSKELLYEQPAFPEVEYIFKHALTQEVAYGSVLQEQRKTLHEQIAQAIEQRYPVNLEDHYSELAHHYSRSGNILKAVHYLYLAGQQAERRSANTEAVAHFTTALELLETLPESPERSQQELDLQISLAIPLLSTKGFASPEVGKAYRRAQELCQGVEQVPQLFTILRGLWMFTNVGGDLHTAQEIAEQLLALAENTQDSDFLVEAHYALGNNLHNLGNLISSRDHLQQALTLYDVQHHRTHSQLYGADPGVYSLVIDAFALWVLGYPSQAQKRVQEVLQLGRELSHPLNIGFALYGEATLLRLCRAAAAVLERAELIIEFSREHGLSQWEPFGTISRGWALAQQGRHDEGQELIAKGSAAWRATGMTINLPWFLMALAEAYGKGGQTEKALGIIAEVLDILQKTKEGWYEAEVHRLKGEVLYDDGGRIGEAESCFQQSLKIARQQRAKSWELRTSISLARLWQQQGKTDEAQQLLSGIYNWFTEGFDTKDLQEAKGLLEELG